MPEMTRMAPVISNSPRDSPSRLHAMRIVMIGVRYCMIVTRFRLTRPKAAFHA